MILKKDFPIIGRKIREQPLVYLDSAATSLKPKSVSDSVSDFYSKHTSNVHRGIHTLSEEATDLFEKSREMIAGFIGAEPHEIIFVPNTTYGVNFLSLTFPSSCVLTCVSEHHSNYLPWKVRHKVNLLELDKNLELDSSEVIKKSRTAKIVALSHISNVTGAIAPIKEISQELRGDTMLFIDGAQSAPHIPVDVSDLGVDSFVFSGHKMLGPSGIGVVYIREELMKKISPVFVGGGTVKSLCVDKIEWQDLPYLFEGGTPDIEGVIGLGAAVKYLERYGMEKVLKYEKELTQHFDKKFDEMGNELKMEVYGPKSRSGISSFNLKGIHSHDISSILDTQGIAIRAGHHCAGLLHDYLGVSSSCRASFYIYNEKKDIDVLFETLLKAREMFDGNLKKV